MMKKIFMTLVAALLVSVACCAQSADAAKSVERIAKLEEMLKKLPAPSGLAELDQYVNSAKDAATAAVANSEYLKAIAEGSVTPETVLGLAAGVKLEKEGMEGAAKQAPEATKAMKSLNPMKMGKAKKAMDFVNKAMEIVSEESTYQAQVLAELSK